MLASYVLFRIAAAHIAFDHKVAAMWAGVRGWLNASHRRKEAYHFAHWLGHAVYFAFVWLEGHGTYAVMGGVMVLLMLIAPFYGED